MTTFATFKRLKEKSVAALKQGYYVAARPCLIQAAECMIAAEGEVEEAREAQQMSKLRAELAQLKGEGQKESK